MSQQPPPLNGRDLSRASIAGIDLALLGIILFIGLWVVLGQAGFQPAPRLFTSLCVPPAIIAAIVGAYVLLRRPSGKQ